MTVVLAGCVSWSVILYFIAIFQRAKEFGFTTQRRFLS